MCPTITYNNKSVELKTSPASSNTVFTLRPFSSGLCILQNDEIIGFVTFPIMKVVRALRKLYPVAKLQVI